MNDFFNPTALGLGMVALINPCGFALLPAYLAYFLGIDDDSENKSWLQALNRSQVVGLSLSAGFVLVFAVIGMIFAGLYGSIAPALAYVTLIIGIGLLGLGVAMIAGFQPVVKLPKLDTGGENKNVVSMFLFGVSYAVASLTCTLPIFFGAVGTASSGQSFGQRFGSLLSYGVGMGLLATVLTLMMAFGKKGIVNSFKALLPMINRVSGVIVIIVGAYLVYYGYWSSRPPGTFPQGPVYYVEWAQSWLSNAIESEPRRVQVLAIGFLLVNAIIAIGGFFDRRSNQEPPIQSSDTTAATETV